MKQLKEHSDRRLKSVCAQCGKTLRRSKRSSDHAPSRCLLRESEGPSEDQYPSNLPTVFTCRGCNEQFSDHEQYFGVFLNCLLVGSTDPADHAERWVQRTLKRHSGLRAHIEAGETV